MMLLQLGCNEIKRQLYLEMLRPATSVRRPFSFLLLTAKSEFADQLGIVCLVDRASVAQLEPGYLRDPGRGGGKGCSMRDL